VEKSLFSSYIGISTLRIMLFGMFLTKQENVRSRAGTRLAGQVSETDAVSSVLQGTFLPVKKSETNRSVMKEVSLCYWLIA